MEFNALWFQHCCELFIYITVSYIHLHFSPTETNIKREPFCCQAPSHNWSKFPELTWFSLTAVPPHLHLRTLGSLDLLCAISKPTTHLGFKRKRVIVNCMHWKPSSALCSGSLSDINQKIILMYNFMGATEFQIWNAALETFCATTDVVTPRINALPSKLSLRGASVDKEGHTLSATLFIAQDDSNKRINAVS